MLARLGLFDSAGSKSLPFLSLSGELKLLIRAIQEHRHRTSVDRKLLIRLVVSMGRRNTFQKFTRGRLKTQSLSRALI